MLGDRASCLNAAPMSPHSKGSAADDESPRSAESKVVSACDRRRHARAQQRFVTACATAEVAGLAFLSALKDRTLSPDELGEIAKRASVETAAVWETAARLFL